MSKRSTESLRYTCAALIREMERQGIVWWIYDGYSIRRMHQTELLMEVEPDGRGSEDREQEPQPEGGDLRGGEADLAAGDDDRIPGSRAVVRDGERGRGPSGPRPDRGPSGQTTVASSSEVPKGVVRRFLEKAPVRVTRRRGGRRRR